MEIIQGSYAEINLDNLIFNYRQVQERVQGKRVCCVIKANAYGHGAGQLAHALEGAGADFFATSSLQEALALRQEGVSSRILVLTGLFQGTEYLAIKNDLDLTVCSYDQALGLAQEAIKQSKEARIHIKVDTGMGRIGLRPDEEGLREITRIASLEGIRLAGIYSHFAVADEDRSYTAMQSQTFQAFLDQLRGQGLAFDLVHMDNTAGALAYDHQADMVRLGIGLYGIYPSAWVREACQLELRPVMTLKSRVSHVKPVVKGQAISYGCTYRASQDTRLATLAIGYADGLPRSLSNRGQVYIKNRPYPIVGRVCMDQVMVDIGQVKIRPGDEVEIFGHDQPIERIADLAGTIPYEILTSVGMRVPRFYLQEAKQVDQAYYLMEGVKNI